MIWYILRSENWGERMWPRIGIFDDEDVACLILKNLIMKKLELSDVICKVPHRINEWMWMFTWIWFKDLLRYNFDFDVYLPTYKMALQRPYVWSNEQKSDFIISCIKWITKWMTPFCFIQHIKGGEYSQEDTKLEVIDWKQRLLTLIWLLKWEVAVIIDWKEYYWDDLSEDVKYKITWNDIKSNVWFEYQGWTDKDKINWFKNINFSWTPMDKEHIGKFI